MSTVTTHRREREEADPGLRTIGVVCEELRDAFPDISVSKIRYLEDQGLIAPKRTRGGYRLFSPEDIARLTTILRLQRDEFLPLRVIREALDGPGTSPDRPRRRAIGLTEHEDEIDGAELCERASVAPEFVKELEEYGVVALAGGGRRAPVRRERGRHRGRMRSPLALRDRRAAPADVPDGDGQAGGARGAARRAGPSLPQPGASKRGARRPGSTGACRAGAVAPAAPP